MENNKRFSVMKIMSDEIKNKAREICFNIAKTLFLDHAKKPKESIFTIPKDFESSSKELMVKEEIINLKDYIFSIQACRNWVLDFNDKEETVRVIEKSDCEEIIEIRQKLK